jgi:peptidyl-dipeptidase A
MEFEAFLESFIPVFSRKSHQLNQAYWILETTGSEDAADLKSALDAELRFLLNDSEIYKKLLKWQKEDLSPILARQLDLLIRMFKQNQIPKEILEEIAKKESVLALSYASFRPELNGKKVSENEIREILKNEDRPEERKKAWNASKEIGMILAPQILDLVRLRNQAAKTVGYDDYFQMQLDLQEVDRQWLLAFLEDFSKQSESAYQAVLSEIEKKLAARFSVDVSDLGPWSWSEPFCQEDPLDTKELDFLVDGVDIPKVCENFYREMGIDITAILQKSDMYERPGKNQHAFCMNLDRGKDVRTLNNVRPSIKWLETVLHELGHAIYELGFDDSLPWLLREPPHMITTEAMALIAGRQAYRFDALASLIGNEKEHLRKKAQESLRRRQLIFSRWVLVMTAFESELYRDPSQDLNRLWWDLVEKYQKIKAPLGREGLADWAAKYHIGLAPVYYFSYLLGEMFASSIQESLVKELGIKNLNDPKVGKFLQQKLFASGNRMNWSDLIKHVTGSPLQFKSWICEFAL